MTVALGPGTPLLCVQAMDEDPCQAGRVYVCREVVPQDDFNSCGYHGDDCTHGAVRLEGIDYFLVGRFELAPGIWAPDGEELAHCLGCFRLANGPPDWAEEIRKKVETDVRSPQKELVE